MKIVVVTNHGSAWVVGCDDGRFGGLNLNDGEFVVSAIPYTETLESRDAIIAEKDAEIASLEAKLRTTVGALKDIKSGICEYAYATRAEQALEQIEINDNKK